MLSHALKKRPRGFCGVFFVLALRASLALTPVFIFVPLECRASGASLKDFFAFREGLRIRALVCAELSPSVAAAAIAPRSAYETFPME
jgi:hypothetical protein